MLASPLRVKLPYRPARIARKLRPSGTTIQTFIYLSLSPGLNIYYAIPTPGDRIAEASAEFRLPRLLLRGWLALTGRLAPARRLDAADLANAVHVFVDVIQASAEDETKR